MFFRLVPLDMTRSSHIPLNICKLSVGSLFGVAIICRVVFLIASMFWILFPIKDYFSFEEVRSHREVNQDCRRAKGTWVVPYVAKKNLHQMWLDKRIDR